MKVMRMTPTLSLMRTFHKLILTSELETSSMDKIINLINIRNSRRSKENLCICKIRRKEKEAMDMDAEQRDDGCPNTLVDGDTSDDEPSFP